MSDVQSVSSDRIVLEWPCDPAYRAVGRLVLGGIASRRDLPVDRVDELALALDALAGGLVSGPNLRLEVSLDSDALLVVVGDFAIDPLADRSTRLLVTGIADDAHSIVVGSGLRVVVEIRLPSATTTA